MEKAGITAGKFIAGIVIAILVSSAVSVGISMQLIKGSQGPAGAAGATGATGATGQAGANGATWWNGTGTPTTSLGRNGDFYLNLANGDVYNKVSGLWSMVANIQGATGATGTQGPPGPQGPYLPDYDSGWVDITDKAGQSVTLTHNLGSTDVIVDVTGLMTQADAPHQFYLGLTGTGNVNLFENTYAGADDEFGYSLIQTSDGGYAIAGNIGDSDVYLVKIDAAGAMRWSKTYDANSDYGYSLIQTADEGYAIAGRNYGGVYLLKTDALGAMEWQKTYGGFGGQSVVQTSDGGYAIAGYTMPFGFGSEDAYLVKTDSAGNHQWNKTYEGSGTDWAYSLVQTSDGGYALAGCTYSFGAGDGDFWLVKTDSSGNKQWDRTYGGTSTDDARSLVQTGDGGYVIAGFTLSFGAGGDVYLVKTDAAGTVQWNKTYGGLGGEFGYSLIQTADGGYAVAGEATSQFGVDTDVYLVKTNAAGIMEWQSVYGGASDEHGRSVVQTSNGGYAIAGYTYRGDGADVYLVKTAVEFGLAWIATANTIVLHRGATDIFWNYVRVRIWKID